MNDDVAQLRTDYSDVPLCASDAGSDPMALFADWFADARSREQVAEANAMSLATADRASGVPSARMVLLKAVDAERGAFGWFTNLDSRKAREAFATDHAAMCWWWPGAPGRQVRAVGRVEQMTRAASAEYFAQRPEAARIGAVASHQSRAVASRGVLDERIGTVVAGEVELPDTWGGLWLVADELEFWQGRSGRLHDRITFLRLSSDGDLLAGSAVEAAGGETALRAAATEVVDAHGTHWLRTRLEP